MFEGESVVGEVRVLAERLRLRSIMNYSCLICSVRSVTLLGVRCRAI